MTLDELKIALETVLPHKVAYKSFPEGQAPALPYIVFWSTGSDNFGADNNVYHTKRTVRVELLSQSKDIKTEQSIEAVLPYWTRTEDYIDDEKCFLTIYETEVK